MEEQEPFPGVVVVHDSDSESLAYVRNEAARLAETDWIIFLDGDDRLAPGFIAAMLTALDEHGSGHMYVPAVQYVRGSNQRARPPRFPRTPGHHHDECDERCLVDGNWLVIGTMIEREAFLHVGGFEEWPIYEDWALFARLAQLGLTTVRVPDAAYMAYRERGSRNDAPQRQRAYWHQRIGHALYPDEYDETSKEEDERMTLLLPNGRATVYVRRR